MTIHSIRTSLAAALILLASGLPLTAEDKPVPQAKSGAVASRTKGKLKPVDINGATKNELGFMLGIPEDQAAKIIAGRPYRTKAHLLTRNIVSAEVYAKIKDKVIAKQTGQVR